MINKKITKDMIKILGWIAFIIGFSSLISGTSLFLTDIPAIGIVATTSLGIGLFVSSRVLVNKIEKTESKPEIQIVEQSENKEKLIPQKETIQVQEAPAKSKKDNLHTDELDIKK